jgi:formate-dependent nitrite reductase membrane component NrfD
MYKVAPLKTHFMVAAIILFLISVLYLWNVNRPWAFALAIFSVILFIASMISMAKGPIEGQIPVNLQKPVKRTVKKKVKKKAKKKAKKKVKRRKK